jgi:hypothetical protein
MAGVLSVEITVVPTGAMDGILPRVVTGPIRVMVDPPIPTGRGNPETVFAVLGVGIKLLLRTVPTRLPTYLLLMSTIRVFLSSSM